jgi:hypothetical protein
LNDVDPVLQTNTEMVVTDDKEMVVTVAAATADARIKMVYGLYRTYGDGLGGNVDGVDGSLSPASLTKAFELLGVNKNTKFTDLGAGAGRPVLAAGEVGADVAVGVELPANVGQKLIFEAVRSKLPEQKRAARCKLTMADIDELAELPPGVYALREGPPAGATSMDQLATGNPTVPALIAQLATLPHLGAPRSAIADGRLVLVIPETGAPRVFDPPSQPGARQAAPRLARIRQVLGAVLHVTDALAAPRQA